MFTGIISVSFSIICEKLSAMVPTSMIGQVETGRVNDLWPWSAVRVGCTLAGSFLDLFGCSLSFVNVFEI